MENCIKESIDSKIDNQVDEHNPITDYASPSEVFDDKSIDGFISNLNDWD